MKKKEFQEMDELNVRDLAGKRDELSRKLYENRVQLRMGQLKNFGVIRGFRKDIARINTLIKRKQTNESRGNND